MTDPRSAPNFQPELYPQCDGLPAPLPAGASAPAKRKLELLAAFYDINRCYQSVAAARKNHGIGSAEERAALQEMEKALRAKDALEDQHAAYGIVGSPKVQAGFIRNVTFTSPQVSKQYSTLSVYFAVPETS